MNTIGPTYPCVGTLNLGGRGNRVQPGLFARARRWAALSGSLLLPLASTAQYQYAISSYAATNYTGYVLAGESGSSGRQAIRTRTVTAYDNSGTTPETAYFRLAYQLLNAANVAVPVLDEAGHSNNVYSVYETTDGTIRFPYGAIWSPHGDALVGAGTIYGTNGLWIIPLGPNGERCQGTPILLPTTPGDALDFAGSVIVAPTTNVLGLFIRLDTNDVVVYWSTNFSGYVLESKPKVGPAAVWTNVPGPYVLNGLNFEHHEPRNALAPTKFFRLHYTGAVLVRPQLLVTIQGNDAVISWSTYFGGYTLQAAGSLSPAAFWQTLPGPHQTAGGSFLYFVPLTGSGPRFYRLRSQ